MRINEFEQVTDGCVLVSPDEKPFVVRHSSHVLSTDLFDALAIDFGCGDARIYNGHVITDDVTRLQVPGARVSHASANSLGA